MAVTASDIAPVSPEAAPTPAPAEPAAPVEGDSDGDGLPDAVLQLPFMAALLQGKPGGVYVENDNPPPEAEVILQYADPLADAGFRIFASKSKPVTVFYNAAVLPPEDVEAADAAGKLDTVVVPFSELQEVFAGAKASGGDEAAPEETAATAEAAPVATAQPVNSPPVSQETTNARVRNLSPGSPTSGPRPGQGRILNNISKPVI